MADYFDTRAADLSAQIQKTLNNRLYLIQHMEVVTGDEFDAKSAGLPQTVRVNGESNTMYFVMRDGAAELYINAVRVFGGTSVTYDTAIVLTRLT